MGLYGNLLCYFQGHFIDLVNFDMKAGFNSGYDKTKDKNGNAAYEVDFRGCFENIKPNQTKDANGLIINMSSGNLWSDTALISGTFVINPDDNLTYRIIALNPWQREAGFYYYDVESVVGDAGNLVTEPAFKSSEGQLA